MPLFSSLAPFFPQGFSEVTRSLSHPTYLHWQHCCEQNPPEPSQVSPTHPVCSGTKRTPRRGGSCQWLPPHGQCFNPHQKSFPAAAFQLRSRTELPGSKAGFGPDWLPKPPHALLVNGSNCSILCRRDGGSSSHCQLSHPASGVQHMGLPIW